MKNRKLFVTILSIVCVFSFIFLLNGCTVNILPSEDSTQDSGSSTYEITVNEVKESNTDKTFSEIVKSVRTTCVDVYCSSEDTFVKASVAGSGVIFAKADEGDEYYIITNHHVIEDQKSFTVTLLFIDELGNETNDNYSADLIGGSKSRDIAVLRIKKKGSETLTVANFADSDKVSVGDDVFAIGNPLGVLGGTVSKGIISAKSRTIYLDEIGNMTLLQTDTATYSGSSGGALFDANGNVIGITNSGYSDYDGLNFAIPSNDALKAAKSLLSTVVKNEDGSVKEYGYVEGDSNIGVVFEEATSSVYKSKTSNDLTDVVYVYSHTDNSDAKELVSYYEYYYSSSSNSTASVDYFHAVNSITVGGTETEITSADQAEELLESVSAGTEISIKVQRIVCAKVSSGFGRMFYSYKYYLDKEETITFTASQYRYSPED